MPSITQLGLAERNQVFLDAETRVDDAIQIVQRLKSSVWRTMIARSAYELGNGLEPKHYRFYPGMGPQRGLQLWHPIQISRKPSAGDPGFDASKYNPHTVTYGFDSVTYGGLGIEHKTPPINIRDLRFAWQLQKQLKAIYGYLGTHTQEVWENYTREQYAYFCNQATGIFAQVSGRYNTQTASYNPFSTDSEGDNVLTIAGTGFVPDVGVLTFDPLQSLARSLQVQAPMSAVSTMNGRPTFAWVGDLDDFDMMVAKDSELHEDYRHYAPEKNVERFGVAKHFRGFAMTHDPFSPRFTIKSKSGNTLTLKRVSPKVSSSAAVTGNRVDVNPEYIHAEYGCFFIFLNDVYSIEVPPEGPASPGGGTHFGTAPGLNGMWKWLNIQDINTNPLMEEGFWFNRIEAFAKPGQYEADPVMVVYKRFTHTDVSDTEVGGSDAASEQDIVADVASGDVDSDNYTIDVTLAGYITAEAGQAITLIADDASEIAGVVQGNNGQVYTLALDSAPTYSDYTAAGGAKVTVA